MFCVALDQGVARHPFGAGHDVGEPDFGQLHEIAVNRGGIPVLRTQNFEHLGVGERCRVTLKGQEHSDAWLRGTQPCLMQHLTSGGFGIVSHRKESSTEVFH